MEKAIKLAIEGGYKTPRGREMTDMAVTLFSREWQFTTSDPKFWQSLAVSLTKPVDISKDGDKYKDFYAKQLKKTQDAWVMHYWHDFINHLIDGKTPDSFFETLLTNNTKQ